MVAETASIVDGGRHKNTFRFIRITITMPFSYGSGNNESTMTKNAGKLLVFSIAMQMQRYDAGHIA